MVCWGRGGPDLSSCEGSELRGASGRGLRKFGPSRHLALGTSGPQRTLVSAHRVSGAPRLAAAGNPNCQSWLLIRPRAGSLRNRSSSSDRPSHAPGPPGGREALKPRTDATTAAPPGLGEQRERHSRWGQDGGANIESAGKGWPGGASSLDRPSQVQGTTHFLSTFEGCDPQRSLAVGSVRRSVEPLAERRSERRSEGREPAPSLRRGAELRRRPFDAGGWTGPFLARPSRCRHREARRGG